MSPELSSASVYTDFQGLDGLKYAAKGKSPDAVRAVAKQFEALFLQMMLKSMRDASPGDPMLDDDQTNMYRDMYDKQLALDISNKGKGIGLADMLVKQLQTMPQYKPADAAAQPLQQKLPERLSTTFHLNPKVKAAESSVSPHVSAAEVASSAESFVQKLWPLAKKAAAKIGASAEALIAQAALETGWGKAVIRHPDGSSSYNLFNIKADQRWQGERVAKQTLEYREGVANKEVAQFRSYGSFEESFNDYVSFLQANPRYAEALKVADEPQRFIQSLQEAGYATDPAYARKINNILGRDLMADAAGALKNSADRTLS